MFALPDTKIVDINTYMPVLIDLLERGESVCLTITGQSMTPFLVHGRDQIRFQKPDRTLQRGDMAFFRRATGEYIMHRICRSDEHGYFFLGDNQQSIEGPIPPEQVFGLIIQVCRKGRWIGPGDFWWDFFAGPWLTLLPCRPLLRKAYQLIGGVFPGRTK